MERTIEINGQKYVRQASDFGHQTAQVLNLLGTEMLVALEEANAIIAGGAILSTFTHQEVNDVDVYFRSEEQMAQAFVRVTKDWDSVYLGHTDKSITLKDRESDVIVQFIYFDYFKDAEAVFEAFDFTVCMAAIELKPESNELVMHPSFLSDMASRTLKFNNGTRFPYISLVRTRKYQERGYKIGRGNLLAIGMACASKPINSWDDAKYQLGGVYGHEIDLELQEDTPFSHDRLHEVVTRIKERSFNMHHDYEEVFEALVGQSYDEYRKAN